MTDQERARAYTASDEIPDPWPQQTEQAAARLVAEFAAVRDDERQTIAVWLLEQTGMVGVADLIARGTYREATS